MTRTDDHPTAVDRLIGAAFFAVWRTVGALALPLLMMHPQARRHIAGLYAPIPGWTWLHGASAGEHTAARALAPHIGPSWRTSSSWRTTVAGAFAAPLDLPFVVGRWLDRARPGRLVLIEAELWPGWLHACRRRNIPIAVVNARPGRGTSRWRRCKPLWRWLTEDVEFIDQAQTGDLKLSTTTEATAVQWDRAAVIAASTRPGDEARMVQAWRTLPQPRPRLFLAPRHLKRLPEVCALLDSNGVDWCRYSVATDERADVVLVDTMGQLADLLQHSRVAFIGGTFDETIGGHSPAEALAAGNVVIHGPHTQANPAAWTQGVHLCAEADSQLASVLREALSMDRPQPVSNDAAEQCAQRLPALRVPGQRPARPWLTPLAPLWRMVVHIARSREPDPTPHDIPVVVVGGLVAGGAGRTPTVAWLASQLTGAWVVSSGYRRRRSGPPVRIGHPETPADHDLGDELEMLRRQGIPVISSPDRSAGVRAAAAAGAQVVVVDGGLGCRSLHRDFTIVCINGHWPQGRGPIPVGDRRLPWRVLHDADAICVHDNPGHLPLPDDILHVDCTTQPTGWLHRGQTLPLEARSGAVHALVGIARPERFVCTLLSLGLTIEQIQILRDHGQIRSHPAGVVLTEKDAARLPADVDLWALQTRLVVPRGDALLQALQARIS